jgi:succinate dehydrogenase / fumarate reductase cytochrome b subunit
MVANILLAIHLYHGVWSMFQSLGVNHPQYTPKLKLVAKLYAFAIGIGNVSMPLAVLTGLVK